MRRLSSHGARPIATNRRSIPRACAPRRVLATIPDQERTRCFALPVLQDRWAFYPDIHHAHSGDLFGGTSNTFKGRLGKIYERSRKEWEECVHAPPGTIRHRIFKFSLKLQSRIDPREILARSLVPPPAVLVANPQTRVPVRNEDLFFFFLNHKSHFIHHHKQRVLLLQYYIQLVVLSILLSKHIQSQCLTALVCIGRGCWAVLLSYQ